MITQKSINNYKGALIQGEYNCLYIPPHEILQPYIANYTISIPNSNISDKYTILPTASSAIVISVNNGKINGRLRGVNTKALNVGTFIKKLELLLLIEFHTGGLYPFLPIEQAELIDTSFPLNEIDNKLLQKIVYELEKAEQVKTLIETLDKIFISRLMNSRNLFNILPVIKNIIKHNGFINTPNLAFPYFYSERQTRRLFIRHVGVNPKMFTRIVRANYSIRLIQKENTSFLDVMEEAGYYDQPHFVHEFKTIHGITPQEYRKNMSVFYNDNIKM